MPVLMYGSEAMVWKKKERSRTRDEQMHNLRSFLSIRGMDSLECTDKGVVRSDERIAGVYQCFGHVERMENDRIAKKVHVGESTVRWIDIVKDYFKKK